MEYKITKSLQDPIEVNKIPLRNLLLDNENPRFAGLLEGASEKDTLLALSEEMYLDELVESFKKNGYYSTEPLLAVPVKRKPNFFLVIEGNRRLAAIKLLMHSENSISEKLRRQLTEEIPVVIYPSRKELWPYLGFRHINGPKEWDSYSKAIYAFTVHKNYKIPVEEIAEKIGDTHNTVVRMFNGLKVLEQAEKQGYFTVKNIELRSFYFSHLYTILQKKNTLKFLGLEKKKEVYETSPVPKGKIKNLETLIELIFGNKEKGIKSIIRSQHPDLKNLDLILGSQKAFSYLQTNSQEEGALELALSYVTDKDAFGDHISKAIQVLRKAKGISHTAKPEKFILNNLDEIREIASLIKDELLKKRP